MYSRFFLSLSFSVANAKEIKDKTKKTFLFSILTMDCMLLERNFGFLQACPYVGLAKYVRGIEAQRSMYSFADHPVTVPRTGTITDM